MNIERTLWRERAGDEQRDSNLAPDHQGPICTSIDPIRSSRTPRMPLSAPPDRVDNELAAEVHSADEEGQQVVGERCR
jgi:hypothetical protein